MGIFTKKFDMPTQPPEKRIHNFDEVALGYTAEIAVKEATRCIKCKNQPCISGCPVNINIPKFISMIAQEDFDGAYKEISLSSALPAICGRVCPQEHQCEGKCTLGIKFEPISIGRLERFVADWHNENSDYILEKQERNGHKVAVIGSGPSGLTCAAELARRGYEVTIYEALHTPGGVLVYGIPEFRLPKKIVKKEIENLKSLGVKIETNIVIGKTLTIEELFGMGYEAAFVGTGAGLPKFMGIPGESLNGVYSANEFLCRSNLMKAYENNSYTPILKGESVAVVGGGNVAMDSARTALRMGAKKVYIIYRRSMDEIPARREEVEHAIEEGVEFRILTNPVEIIGYNSENNLNNSKNGFVRAIKCVKMELGDFDEDGRRIAKAVPDSEYILDVDTVIISIGTYPNPLIKNTTKGLKVNSKGCIIVDESCLTSCEGIYAGGDSVTGAATVISAMGAGKSAAKSIDEYLKNK